MAPWLQFNGLRPVAARAEAARTILDLAAGRADLSALAAWLCDHLAAL